MNFYDLLIIYLACGAPFGVYYFLQHRHRENYRQLLLKSIFVCTIWAVFAVKQFTKTKFFQNRFAPSVGEETVRSKKVGLENALREIDPNVSFREVRAIFDRYVNLTIARGFQIAPVENEIFHIVEHKNSELASICLERRNRRKLDFHQTLARLDFLDLLAGKPEVAKLAVDLVSLLKDAEAKRAIEEMFDVKAQTGEARGVKNPEEVLWNSETHKPVFTKIISNRLKTLTASTSLREKD